MKIRINSDVYDICNRIRDIDRDYLIVFDTNKDLYEVHNLSQVGSSYCFTIPYKYLDSRVLDMTNETMSKNIDTILARIDNDNKIRESAEKTSTLNFLIDRIQDGR